MCILHINILHNLVQKCFQKTTNDSTHDTRQEKHQWKLRKIRCDAEISTNWKGLDVWTVSVIWIHYTSNQSQEIPIWLVELNRATINAGLQVQWKLTFKFCLKNNMDTWASANFEFSKSRLKGSVQRVELPWILVQVYSRGCLSPYTIYRFLHFKKQIVIILIRYLTWIFWYWWLRLFQVFLIFPDFLSFPC